jgi:hypothetical protein
METARTKITRSPGWLWWKTNRVLRGNTHMTAWLAVAALAGALVAWLMVKLIAG